jgi:hypothetical protein
MTRNVTIIHCWSAPRSRSTALMYAFDARDDCAVLDEPLYRFWLEENQEYVSRPYTQELINATPHADSKVEDHFKWKREIFDLNTRIEMCLEDLDGGGGGDAVIFMKHMAKHSPHFDFEKNCEVGKTLTVVGSSSDMLDQVKIHHKHLLLIRDPVSILSSWNAASAVHNGAVTPNEIGIIHLLSIYSNVQSKINRSGDTIISVLDSDDLAANPNLALEHICSDLDIPFTTQMLSWEEGPKKCDGPWADWWYQGVHKSTGISSHHARKYQTLDPNLLPALRASLGAYDFLKQLTFRYQKRGPPADTIYEDPRNEHVLVYIGAPGFGQLIPRQAAGVSPFDSIVQGGDGTWEGMSGLMHIDSDGYLWQSAFAFNFFCVR